jgi:transcription elongation factor Elf1
MIYLAAMIGAILGLKRRCPRCGRDQVVPKGNKHETVKCKFCGAEIPPKRQMK